MSLVVAIAADSSLDLYFQVQIVWIVFDLANFGSESQKSNTLKCDCWFVKAWGSFGSWSIWGWETMNNWGINLPEVGQGIGRNYTVFVKKSYHICDALRDLVVNAFKRCSNGWPKRSCN